MTRAAAIDQIHALMPRLTELIAAVSDSPRKRR